MEGMQLAEQIKKTIDALEQMFGKDEKLLEGISSAISTYVESTEIAKAMMEAANAEIESKGRASKRTIYGRYRARAFKKKRGKGLVQYLGEKGWALYQLIRLIGNERAESAALGRYLQGLLKEEEQVGSNEEEVEGEEKENKKKEKRIKHAEKILRRSEKLIDKEANIDKKLERITNREMKFLKYCYYLSIREGYLARKLMRLIGASHAYKRLEILMKKEEIIFSKFIKIELWVSTETAKSLKMTFKAIKEDEKALKVLGVHESLGREEKESKGEFKESKRVRGLMKRLGKIQKHLRKIQKGAAKYGSKISGSISMLDSEEKKLMKEEEEEEKELAGLERAFEYMQKFDEMINRLLNIISTSDVRIIPQMKWINGALISTMKIYKKNPSGVQSFLSRVSAFAEKAILPALENLDNERKEISKEFTEEEGIMRYISNDLSYFHSNGNAFLSGLEKIDKSLIELEKSAVKGREKSIKDLKKDIKELRWDLKVQRAVEKGEKNAGAQLEMKRIEIKRKIAELNNKIKEIETKFTGMKKEFNPIVSEMRRIIKGFPTFDAELKYSKEMSDEINSITDMMGEGEEETSDEIQNLQEWISNPTQFESYEAFAKELLKSSGDDFKMCRTLEGYSRTSEFLEYQLKNDIENSERRIDEFERVVSELGNVVSKYPDLFGEEGRDIYSEVQSNFNNIRMILTEMKKLDSTITAMAQMVNNLSETSKSLMEHSKELSDLSKEVFKISKKLKKIVGKEFQVSS